MLTRGRVHPRWPSLAESAFPAVRSAARRRRWAGSASPSSAARNGAWHTAQVHEMFVEVMAKKRGVAGRLTLATPSECVSDWSMRAFQKLTRAFSDSS